MLNVVTITQQLIWIHPFYPNIMFPDQMPFITGLFKSDTRRYDNTRQKHKSYQSLKDVCIYAVIKTLAFYCLSMLNVCKDFFRFTGLKCPHKGQWRGAFMFLWSVSKQQLNKQWKRWWFETPSHSVWRRCNVCCLDFGDMLRYLKRKKNIRFHLLRIQIQLQEFQTAVP